MSKPKDVNYEDYDQKIKEMEEKFDGKWEEFCLDLINVPSAYALDVLWERIILKRKPDYGDWEYPVQASRHLIAEWEQLEQEYDALLKERQAKFGTELIRRERQRHFIEEGWSAQHDSQWTKGELVKAAICYAASGISRRGGRLLSFLLWPWHRSWYKPRFSSDDLVRAGALIAAELDRRGRDGD